MARNVLWSWRPRIARRPDVLCAPVAADAPRSGWHLENLSGGRISRLMDVSIYFTVAAGYLIAVVQATEVTLPGFLLLTGANIAWLAVFQLMSPRANSPRTLRLYAMSLVACALLALGALWLGGYYDWMLPVITVSGVASMFPPRSALLYASVNLVAAFATLGLRYDFGTLQEAVTLLPAFVFAFLFPFVIRWHVQQTERAEALVAQLEEAQEQLRTYASQVEELTADRERNRIAREIHDTLGHYLTILAVELETALKLYDRADPRLRDELVEARRAAAECLGEVRRSVAALRPNDPTARSFEQALARLAAEFEAVAPETQIVLDAEGPLQELPAELRVALYRCVQEALTNVRKHAAASKVLARLRVDDCHAELTVLDNGAGAASGADGHEPGFGLLGMRERIALLGGTAMAQPDPGRGWRVEVRVPVTCPLDVPRTPMPALVASAPRALPAAEDG
ncbi:MAG TPA: sensor histidine kinase [Ktedonobacterales bacterium]|nr:sensor histidine kinase [Ktedonobacterales bacterium]